MKKIEVKDIFTANAIYKKTIQKEKKTVSLYLDWKDETTYVGEGKLIEILDLQPIIMIDNPSIKNTFLYFRPKRCLCEIIESTLYSKGFKKHFVIPFRITKKIAEEILLLEERRFNKSSNNISTNLILNVMSYNNSLVDSLEEVKLSEKVSSTYRTRSTGFSSEESKKIKEKLIENQRKRQDYIDRQFDKLYPEKAKKLLEYEKKRKIKSI